MILGLRVQKLPTNSIHNINALSAPQLPGARGEGVRFAGERADRTQVNNVPAQLRLEHLFHVCPDLRGVLLNETPDNHIPLHNNPL